jgi:hypothetical protein
VPDPEPKTAVARLVLRVVRGDPAGKALSLVLALLVGAVAAILLAPGVAHRLPGTDSLGTPAPATLKADRDYDIADPDATAHRREEAAAAERSVWDHDVGAADQAADRIRAAFALMREEEAAFRRGAPAPAGPREEPELTRRFLAQRDAFVARLQVVVPEADLAALARARFSPAVEAELVGLAGRGLSGMVVEDLQLLAADRERGFVVRTFRGGLPEGERVVAGLVLVRDVATARAEVAAAAQARLGGEPPALQGAALRIALAMVRPTLVHAQAEGERRRAEASARVKPVVVPVKRGERILEAGERIEKRHLVVVEGMRAQRRDEDLLHLRLGGGLVVGLAVMALWRFGRRSVARFKPTRRDALLLATLMIGTLVLGFVGLAVTDALHERFPGFPGRSLRYLVPFAAGAMLVRQVLSAEAALLFAVASGLGAGLLAGQSLPYAIYALVTSTIAAGAVGGRDRTRLFRAGLAVGAGGAAVVAALGLLSGKPPGEIAASSAAAFLAGAFVLPVAAVGSLPVVEGVFGYVTDLKLLELANLNHPALKELIVQAPGTYHHSILMGSLVEAAAQAIGANPLLARVMAYYHDVGKIRNPLLFAENQRGENRHDALAPAMSALIVKRHVADGLELARTWRLPRIVADAIPQHHGTRHVGYFWVKAQRAAEEAGGKGPPLDEALFRYLGPKPQSREAALVMIADACEASGRALDGPDSEALRALVHKRINEVFSEGQLDECELTLRDLNAIAGAMVSAMEALYHTRPEYPAGRPPGGGDRPAVQLVVKA